MLKFISFIYIANISQLIASFAIHMTLLSVVTLEEYGIYALIMGISSISIALCRLGINFNIVLSVSRDEEYKHNLWIYVFFLALFSAFIAIVASNLQFDFLKINAFILGLFTGTSFINQAVITNLQSKENFLSYCAIKIIDALFILCACALLTLYSLEKFDYLFIFFTISLFFQNLIFSNNSVTNSMRYFSILKLKECANDSIRFAVGSISKDIAQRVDLFIIQWFCGTKEVGIFSFMLKIIDVIGRFPDSIAVILLPALVKSKKDVKTIYYSLLCAFIVCVLSIVSPFVLKPILHLINSELISHIMVIFYFIPGIVCLSIWKILINKSIAIGDARLLGYTQVVNLLFKISIGSIAGYLYGLLGVIIVWNLANLSLLFVQFMLENQKSSSP